MPAAESTLEQLRGLLHEPPAEALWDDLVAVIDRERDDEVCALAAAYAASALDATWPDALRVAPRRWWRAALAGQPAPGWPMVRALELDAGEGLHDALRSPLTGTLTTLRLSPAPIPHRALRALLADTDLRTIHTLDASPAPWLGPAELDALVALPGWSVLHTLRLHGASLSVALVRALSTSRLTQRAPDRPHLTALHIEGPASDPDAPLALWEDLTHVPHLALHRLNVDARLASAFARRRGPTGLTALDLSHNPLQGALLSLTPAPWFANLEALTLRDASLSWRDLRALARALHAPGLRHLALDTNALEDEGIAQLAAATGLTALRDLSLRTTRITDRGVDALHAAPWFATLERLDLSDNPLTPHALAALRAHLPPTATLTFHKRRLNVLDPEE